MQRKRKAFSAALLCIPLTFNLLSPLPLISCSRFFCFSPLFTSFSDPNSPPTSSSSSSSPATGHWSSSSASSADAAAHLRRLSSMHFEHVHGSTAAAINGASFSHSSAVNSGYPSSSSVHWPAYDTTQKKYLEFGKIRLASAKFLLLCMLHFVICSRQCYCSDASAQSISLIGGNVSSFSLPPLSFESDAECKWNGK